MQYTFIYQALLEYYLYGDTELDVSSLEKHLQALHGPTAHFDKIGLEEEFRVSADLLSRRTGLVHTKLVAAASSPRNARKSKGIYPARDFQWKNHGNFQSSAAMSLGGGGGAAVGGISYMHLLSRKTRAMSGDGDRCFL